MPDSSNDDPGLLKDRSESMVNYLNMMLEKGRCEEALDRENLLKVIGLMTEALYKGSYATAFPGTFQYSAVMLGRLVWECEKRCGQ